MKIKMGFTTAQRKQVKDLESIYPHAKPSKWVRRDAASLKKAVEGKHGESKGKRESLFQTE